MALCRCTKGCVEMLSAAHVGSSHVSSLPLCCLQTHLTPSCCRTHADVMLLTIGAKLVPSPGCLRTASAAAARQRAAITAPRRCRTCALASAVHDDVATSHAHPAEEREPAAGNLAAFLTSRSTQTLDAGLHIVPTPIGASSGQCCISCGSHYSSC